MLCLVDELSADITPRCQHEDDDESPQRLNANELMGGQDNMFKYIAFECLDMFVVILCIKLGIKVDTSILIRKSYKLNVNFQCYEIMKTKYGKYIAVLF